MKKLKTISIWLLFLVVIWGGFRAAQAVTYTKPDYRRQHWDIVLNATISAIQADVTTLYTNVAALGTTVANWVTTVDSPVLINATPTYASANSFTLTGDYTSVLTVGRRVIADCGQDTLVGNTVVSATYAAPTTTVTLTYNNLTSNLVAVSYYGTRSGAITYGSGDILASEYGSPSWANLQAAVAVANASGRRLVLTPGTWPVSDDLAITTSVYTVSTAIFQPATTKTLTLSKFDGTSDKHFDYVGTGKVEFGDGAVDMVRPEWWGAIPDGATDNAAAINAAATANSRGVVKLSNGTYQIASKLSYKAQLHGAGMDKTVIQAAPGFADDMMLDFYTDDLLRERMSIKDIYWDANNVSGLSIFGSSNVAENNNAGSLVEQCRFGNVTGDYAIKGTTMTAAVAAPFTGMTLLNCYMTGCDEYILVGDGYDDFLVIGTRIHIDNNSTGRAILLTGGNIAWKGGYIRVTDPTLFSWGSVKAPIHVNGKTASFDNVFFECDSGVDMTHFICQSGINTRVALKDIQLNVTTTLATAMKGLVWANVSDTTATRQPWLKIDGVFPVGYTDPGFPLAEVYVGGSVNTDFLQMEVNGCNHFNWPLYNYAAASVTPARDTVYITGNHLGKRLNHSFRAGSTSSVPRQLQSYCTPTAPPLILTHTAFNPADSTTYYVGLGGSPSTTDGVLAFVMPRTGVITRVDLAVIVQGTLGTTEDTTASLRIGTTDTTISAAVKHNAARNSYSLTGQSLIVTAGANVQIKLATPAWATNPTTVTYVATVYYE